MNNNDRINLIRRIYQLEGLTDRERSALLGLLRESKTYGLVWEDKPEAVEERLQEELPVLKEVPERAIVSDAPDAPNHILIEGDNLEALTTLAYTHAGRIDVIYIDPPYNTGNKDFVYNDSFVDREDTYRHSKWLSFMSRRLKIAKQLLSDKGVIFISIDDNEQAQLKLLCDEIFGQKNMLANLIWKSKSGGAADSRYIAVDHEYILVYGVHPDNIKPFMDNQADVTTSYNQKDENGEYALDRLDKQSIRYSKSLDYEIIGPDGQVYRPRHKNPQTPNATWRWSRETVRERYGELVFRNGNVYTKNYRKEKTLSRSLLIEERFGRTRTGKTELASILPDTKFTAPKPSKLLYHLLNVYCAANNKSAVILDFFAGSGTTLHATMQLNAEDGGRRQCILVTNNENGICENVTYERNKRAIQGYTTPKGEQVAGLTGNTLRYYKTDFVGRTRSVQNMRRLVNLSTDMLCIKENLYAEQPAFCGERTYKNIFRYFDNGRKRMLVVYREEAIDRLVELIYGMNVEGKIIIYVFSPGEDPWEDSFADVADKVELCALPAAIYNAYRRILPKKKVAAATTEEDAQATHKAETPANGMLNFTDEGDEA